MQDIVYNWAISIVIAIIFSAVISSLLPDTSIKKYVKVVLGVVVSIIILTPLISAFGKVNVESEIQNALTDIEQNIEYEFDSAAYKDYVQKVYMPE